MQHDQVRQGATAFSDSAKGQVQPQAVGLGQSVASSRGPVERQEGVGMFECFDTASTRERQMDAHDFMDTRLAGANFESILQQCPESNLRALQPVFGNEYRVTASD